MVKLYVFLTHSGHGYNGLMRYTVVRCGILDQSHSDLQTLCYPSSYWYQERDQPRIP
jgi:hypothetical protein